MKGINITHNSQDIIFKKMSELFKDETLKYHELNFPKIISVKRIDIPVINVSNQNMDFCSFVQKVSLVMLQKHFPKSHLRSK